MKNSLESMGQRVAKTATVFLVGITLLGCRQNSSNSTSGLPGDPKPTMAFWRAVQEPGPRNTLFDRLAGVEADKVTPQETHAIQIAFRQLAVACREKATQITSLPLARVDPDAARYGVKKVKMLNAVANTCESSASLSEKQGSFTDGGTLALDYIFSLARHADEGKDAWESALMEQLVQKAKTLGNLQNESQELAGFVKAAGAAAADLKMTEMQTRIVMTQRYGLEFPTWEALKKANPAPQPQTISTVDLASSREALMQNLIRRQITLPSGGTWTFDGMGEFQSFDAMRGTNYGDVVDYEVATNVKGWLTGDKHKLRLLMTYQNQNDTEKLILVHCL